MANDSFIAFKLPTPLKSRLQRMADKQGVNLSQLLRRQCIELLGQPGVEREAAKLPGTADGRWLSFWR